MSSGTCRLTCFLISYHYAYSFVISNAAARTQKELDIGSCNNIIILTETDHESFRASEFFDPEDLLQVSARRQGLLALRGRPSIRRRQHFRRPASPGFCHTNAGRDPGTS